MNRAERVAFNNLEFEISDQIMGKSLRKSIILLKLYAHQIISYTKQHLYTLIFSIFIFILIIYSIILI